MASAIKFYRAMSYVVGVALLILCVGIVLRYGDGEPLLEKVVGPLHGALYIVYLVAVVNLATKAKLRVATIVAMVLAGFVPFLAFYVEHRVVTRLEVPA
jgi:integral membrane protein